MSCKLPYPRDKFRYDFFVKESNQHQAKMELRTYLWLVNKYTKVGDTILDPMSGVGTVHLANIYGRRTVAIELMPDFVDLQTKNIWEMRNIPTRGLYTDRFKDIIHLPNDASPHPIILLGDCRSRLPLGKPVDAVIFSPPYGDLWAQSKGPKSKVEEEKNYNVGYGISQANVGNYKTYPHYLTAMEIIYRKCLESLKPGGVLVTVVKDYIRNAKRIYCSKDNLKACLNAGFVFEDWHLRDASMTSSPFSEKAKAQRIAAGKHTKELEVDREDIIVVRKPWK